MWAFGAPGTRPLRIGIGGPVGSGKTALVAALCRRWPTTVSIVVVTNDIFTTEDAEALRRMAVLADERIIAGRDRRAARTPRSATTSPPTSTRSSSSRQPTRRSS